MGDGEWGGRGGAAVGEDDDGGFELGGLGQAVADEGAGDQDEIGQLEFLVALSCGGGEGGGVGQGRIPVGAGPTCRFFGDDALDGAPVGGGELVDAAEAEAAGFAEGVQGGVEESMDRAAVAGLERTGDGAVKAAVGGWDGTEAAGKGGEEGQGDAAGQEAEVLGKGMGVEEGGQGGGELAALESRAEGGRESGGQAGGIRPAQGVMAGGQGLRFLISQGGLTAIRTAGEMGEKDQGGEVSSFEFSVSRVAHSAREQRRCWELFAVLWVRGGKVQVFSFKTHHESRIPDHGLRQTQRFSPFQCSWGKEDTALKKARAQPGLKRSCSSMATALI